MRSSAKVHLLANENVLERRMVGERRRYNNNCLQKGLRRRIVRPLEGGGAWSEEDLNALARYVETHKKYNKGGGRRYCSSGAPAVKWPVKKSGTSTNAFKKEEINIGSSSTNPIMKKMNITQDRVTHMNNNISVSWAATRVNALNAQPPQQPQQPQQPQHQNIPSRLRNLEQEIGLGHVGQIRERISRIENELLDPLQRLPPGAGIRARIASCESFL